MRFRATGSLQSTSIRKPSLSTLFGYQPELDVGENETLYGAIRYDDARRELPEIVRGTYIPNLHIVPGHLELDGVRARDAESVDHTPVRKISLFFARIGEALAHVRMRYDVVVIDCPPQLGFLTLSALCAATAVLITVHPQMLDVMSMCSVPHHDGNLLDIVANAGGATNTIGCAIWSLATSLAMGRRRRWSA